MRLVGQIGKSIVTLISSIAGWAVPVMIVLIMFEVFNRYVLGQSPMVADEFSGYLLVVLAYLGVAYTWKEKGHIRITALVSRLPHKTRSYIRLMTMVLTFAFSVLLTLSSYNYLATSFQIKMKSPSVWLTPLQWPQMAIPIGFTILTILTLISVIEAISTVRSGRSIDEGIGT